MSIRQSLVGSILAVVALVIVSTPAALANQPLMPHTHLLRLPVGLELVVKKDISFSQSGSVGFSKGRAIPLNQVQTDSDVGLCMAYIDVPANNLNRSILPAGTRLKLHAVKRIDQTSFTNSTSKTSLELRTPGNNRVIIRCNGDFYHWPTVESLSYAFGDTLGFASDIASPTVIR